MILTSAAFAAVAGENGHRFIDVEEQARRARGEMMVDDAVRAVSAYSFDNVPLLDGESFHDGRRVEDADLRVDMAVTPASENLLRIRAVLRDNRTSRELARVETYRGRS